MRSFLWAALGTLFMFLMTALGAALVFVFKSSMSPRANRLCMGFAGGVMSAAAVFSLLLPAIEGSPAASMMGFLLGAAMMLLLDSLLGRLDLAASGGDAFRKKLLMISAVTLHNVPEGLAVGLALSRAACGNPAALYGACALAFGVGIQNIPEGTAVALPLYQSGMSRKRSFMIGALSGAVEPMAGIAAALLASCLAPAMPMLMSACAGAMMWVVFCEMLPESGKGREGTLAATLGYALMMALDVGLG